MNTRRRGLLYARRGYRPMQAEGGIVSSVEIGQQIWTIHSFTEPGTHKFLVYDIGGSSGEIDVLIVAGGGSAGSARTGGGGGAGGLVYLERFRVEVGHHYEIAVGSGGIAPSSGAGNNGANSYFGDVVAIGGGGGGQGVGDIAKGKDGGSGGGNRHNTTLSISGGIGLQPVSLSGGFGNPGGGNAGNWYGGAGGGAGQPGSPGTSTNQPGKGGDGLYFGQLFGDN